MDKIGLILKRILLTKISIIISLILLSSLSFITIPRVLAQSKMESDNYKIQFPNLNSGAGVPTSTHYNVNSTIGALSAGLFESTNYKVRSGFQYVHTLIPFSFTISSININLGTLSSQTPSTQNATLTVKAGGAGGYSVKAQENHPMQNSNTSATISDTTCDNGNCTQTSAEVWSQNTTYGFGFNMNGDDIPSDFTDTTYFRQFSDASLSESPATIMNKTEVTWDYPNNTWPWESSATITYKANISGVQAAGVFRNIITFTAVPSF